MFFKTSLNLFIEALAVIMLCTGCESQIESSSTYEPQIESLATDESNPPNATVDSRPADGYYESSFEPGWGHYIENRIEDYIYVGADSIASRAGQTIRIEDADKLSLSAQSFNQFNIGDILRIDASYLTANFGSAALEQNLHRIYSMQNVTHEYYQNKDFNPIDIMASDFAGIPDSWAYLYNSAEEKYASIIRPRMLLEEPGTRSDIDYSVFENGEFLRNYSKRIAVIFDNFAYYFLTQNDTSGEEIFKKIENNIYFENSNVSYYLGKDAADNCTTTRIELGLEVKVLKVTSFDNLCTDSIYSEFFKETYYNEYGLYAGHIERNRGDNCFIVGEIVTETNVLFTGGGGSYVLILQEGAPTYFNKGDIVFICSSGSIGNRSKVFDEELVGSIYTVKYESFYFDDRIYKPFAILNISIDN